jgi:hypothetical protein
MVPRGPATADHCHRAAAPVRLAGHWRQPRGLWRQGQGHETAGRLRAPIMPEFGFGSKSEFRRIHRSFPVFRMAWVSLGQTPVMLVSLQAPCSGSGFAPLMWDGPSDCG